MSAQHAPTEKPKFHSMEMHEGCPFFDGHNRCQHFPEYDYILFPFYTPFLCPTENQHQRKHSWETGFVKMIFANF